MSTLQRNAKFSKFLLIFIIHGNVLFTRIAGRLSKRRKRYRRSYRYSCNTMNSSRECKKAVNRNNAFEGNLQKDLESIEGQRKRIMRSLREKKLNFIEKKSTLPKIRLSKHLSLDNADLSKLCERSLLTKKRLSIPNAMTYLETQNVLLTKPEAKKITPSSQLPISTDVSMTLLHSPRLTRRTQSEGLQSETKTALDQQLGENSAAEIPGWEGDQSGDHTEMGLFKTSLRVQPSPFTTFSLGTHLPHSPLVQRQQQHSSQFLSPLDISGEQQSVSLPCSPRVHRRRRAESLPQDAELNQERKEVFAELIRARQKLRSMSLGCGEIVEASKEVSSLIKCLN